MEESKMVFMAYEDLAHSKRYNIFRKITRSLRGACTMAMIITFALLLTAYDDDKLYVYEDLLASIFLTQMVFQLFLLGLYLCTELCYNKFKVIKKCTVETIASIEDMTSVDVEDNGFRSKQGIYAYNYRYKDSNYTAMFTKRNIKNFVRFYGEDSINIHINPDNPMEFYVDGKVNKLLYVLWGLLGGVISIISFLGVIIMIWYTNCCL